MILNNYVFIFNYPDDEEICIGMYCIVFYIHRIFLITLITYHPYKNKLHITHFYHL